MMTQWRWTGRRVLIFLISTTVIFSLFIFRLLQDENVSLNRDLFRFEPRVVFRNQSHIPGAKVNVLVAEKAGPLIYGERSSELPSTGAVIPRIIHQTWSTYQVPTTLVRWIKTFVDKNPDYEYWFWTDADALELVRRKYPEYLQYYEKYEKSIQRADVMRYFLLHQFGGFYADLDISAVQSLEPLRTHPCIVSQEPWVHAKVYWGWDRLMPCNAFMAAAPQHPFMKMLITTIPRNFDGNAAGDVMNKTGPMMLDRILRDYEREQKDYVLSDRIYLAQPNVFHPKYDPNLRARYIEGCDNPTKFHLVQSEIDECRESKARGYALRLPPEAFTVHHWMHYWVGGTFVSKVNPSSNTHIKNVVPAVINVSAILQTL